MNYFVEYNKLNMFIPWRSGNCWVTKPIFIYYINVEIRAIYVSHKFIVSVLKKYAKCNSFYVNITCRNSFLFIPMVFLNALYMYINNMYILKKIIVMKKPKPNHFKNTAAFIWYACVYNHMIHVNHSWRWQIKAYCC